MTEVSPCLRATNKTPINFLHLEVKWSKDRLGEKQRASLFSTGSAVTQGPLMLTEWILWLSRH